jgi:PleD family two-component response regulator
MPARSVRLVIPQFKSREVPVQTDGAPKPANAAAQAILVVDDALPIRRKLAEILQRSGSGMQVAVHEATTPGAALDQFDALKPKVVLAELIGASADEGLEVILEMLRRDPSVRIILVTAEPADSPYVRRAVRVGVFAVVQKPLRHEKIRQALQELSSEDGGIDRLR